VVRARLSWSRSLRRPTRHARLGFDGVGAIGGSDRVLLLKYVAAVVEPLGPAPVPFDELISPRGALGIRGLRDGFLRDRSGTGLQFAWVPGREIPLLLTAALW
jgi:hypothetical protein